MTCPHCRRRPGRYNPDVGSVVCGDAACYYDAETEALERGVVPAEKLPSANDLEFVHDQLDSLIYWRTG